jgi:hypothetical protein
MVGGNVYYFTGPAGLYIMGSIESSGIFELL